MTRTARSNVIRFPAGRAVVPAVPERELGFRHIQDNAPGSLYLTDFLMPRPSESILMEPCDDSMKPTINPGDYCMFDSAEPIRGGDVVLALYDCGRYIRRLHVDGRGGYWLDSDNPEYAPFRVSPASVLAKMTFLIRPISEGRQHG